MMNNPPFIQTIRLMRKIDQYLGPPICIALALVRSLAGGKRRRGRTVATGEIRKVLVIKFWGMGSIVLATPALRALKATAPGCTVTFLTFEQNESLCRMIRSIDRVYPYRAAGPVQFLLSFVDLIRFLRREKFDAVIDWEFAANFTSIVTALSGARMTIGFLTPKFWRESFYTTRVSFDQSRHITEIFLKAPQALAAGGDGDDLEDLMVDPGKAAAPLDQILAERNVERTDPLICINVNASPLDHKRRWPLDSYRQLIDRILTDLRGFRVILVGSQEDVPYVAGLMRVLAANPHLINLSGRIGLEQLVLLVQRSQLFIGNDSGPLHLAAAAGVPTVSFFGPETPSLYGPRGAAHTVLYKNIPCSPCLSVHNFKDNSFCRNNLCMQSITVDEAWAAVCDQLQEPEEQLWSAEAAGGAR